MSILNKIAARLLGAFVAAVPERNPTAGSETPGRLWRYTITDDDGSPYLTRVLFPRVPVLGFRPMLHKFHRPDGDRSLHNHPWRWALSIVLAGSYVEERLEPDESRLAGRRKSVNGQAKSKAYHLLATYNLSLVRYLAMFFQQGCRCACCGTTEPGGRNGWHVDHDHNKNPVVVRGICCQQCNVMLGNAGDSVIRLEKGIHYLALKY